MSTDEILDRLLELLSELSTREVCVLWCELLFLRAEIRQQQAKMQEA